MGEDERRLLKIPEVTRRLGIGPTKVYELIASGEIESVRIGGARRIPSDAVDAFIQRLRDGHQPAGVSRRRIPRRKAS